MVLHFFGSSLFLQCFFLFKFPISVTPSGMVRARLSSKPLFSVSEREPLPRKSSPAGPRSGKVRARLPPKPLFSVSEREPPPRKSSPAGPGSEKVRARLPPKPLFSVSGREPLPRKSGTASPGSGKVRARLPPNPLFSVSGREPLPGNHHRPARAPEKFALASPLTLCFPFPSANHRPEIITGRPALRKSSRSLPRKAE